MDRGGDRADTCRLPGRSGTWRAGRCFQRLLPHALAAIEHAERLGVAGRETGWLLSWASGYFRERGQPRQARPLAERALIVTQTALPPDHEQRSPSATTNSAASSKAWGSQGGAQGVRAGVDHLRSGLRPGPSRGRHRPPRPRHRAPRPWGAHGGAPEVDGRWCQEAAYGPGPSRGRRQPQRPRLVLQDLEDLAGARREMRAGVGDPRAGLRPGPSRGRRHPQQPRPRAPRPRGPRGGASRDTSGRWPSTSRPTGRTIPRSPLSAVVLRDSSAKIALAR